MDYERRLYETETFEAKVYDPMMQKKIDQNECTHLDEDGEDAWNLVYSDIDRNEFSYVYARVKCERCAQERYGSWGINEKEGFEIVKGEEGRMPKMYGFYGAETFNALDMDKVKHQHYKDMIALLESQNDLSEMDKVKLHHYKDMLRIHTDKSGYGMICNCGNTSGWIVRSWSSQEQAPEGFFNTIYHIECPSCREYVITYQRNDSPKSPFKMNAETFDVEFNEWADQELMSHGKDISFKDWAQDEGMKHGNTEITEWAQHEDESHDARYGAEEHRFMIACGRCGWNFTDEYIKNNTDGNIRPMYGDHCSCGGMVKRYDFEPEAKPKGFFKKLFGKNAESNQFPSMHYGDHDSDAQEKYQEFLDEWDLDDDPPSFEEWYKGDEYHEAEGKKRSGLLSEPFEGTSLDSGEWKGILTGFSIGLLGLFGYSKLRK
jgi:hypothetical protein